MKIDQARYETLFPKCSKRCRAFRGKSLGRGEAYEIACVLTAEEIECCSSCEELRAAYYAKLNRKKREEQEVRAVKVARLAEERGWSDPRQCDNCGEWFDADEVGFHVCENHSFCSVGCRDDFDCDLCIGEEIDEEQTSAISRALENCIVDHRPFLRIVYRAHDGDEWHCHVCGHARRGGLAYVFESHGGERYTCSQKCAIEYCFFRRAASRRSPFFPQTRSLGELVDARNFEDAVRIVNAQVGAELLAAFLENHRNEYPRICGALGDVNARHHKRARAVAVQAMTA